MLKNIIRIINDDEPNHFIVRKSKYILFFTIFLGLLGLLLLLVTMYLASGIYVSREEAGILGQFFGGVIGILFIVGQLCVWGLILAKLVNYFYSFTIIEGQNVIAFKYKLFFEEEVHSAELYRILTIEYTRNGILESFCNYGDITLQMQNDTAIVINNIPRPKFVVSKIEKLKKHAIQNRLPTTEEEIIQQAETTGNTHSSSNNIELEQEKKNKGVTMPSMIRNEIKDQVYEEIRHEIKEDLKEEVKEEVKDEVRKEVQEEVQEGLTIEFSDKIS